MFLLPFSIYTKVCYGEKCLFSFLVILRNSLSMGCYLIWRLKELTPYGWDSVVGQYYITLNALSFPCCCTTFTILHFFSLLQEYESIPNFLDMYICVLYVLKVLMNLFTRHNYICFVICLLGFVRQFQFLAISRWWAHLTDFSGYLTSKYQFLCKWPNSYPLLLRIFWICGQLQMTIRLNVRD